MRHRYEPDDKPLACCEAATYGAECGCQRKPLGTAAGDRIAAENARRELRAEQQTAARRVLGEALAQAVKRFERIEVSAATLGDRETAAWARRQAGECLARFQRLT